MKKIYLDNGATTGIYPAVREEMIKTLSCFSPNPASPGSLSDKSRKIMNDTREIIASSLNVSPEEIYFTSGGSESNSWAVTGVAMRRENLRKKIISSLFEHKSVLNSLDYAEKFTAGKTLVGIDGNGMIRTEEIEENLSSDYSLGSFMAANNEIGTVQEIRKIGDILHEKDVIFHTDAVAAYCHIPLDAKKLGIDMLSASAHKFGGPKGTGFLFVKKGVQVESLIFGGSQERGLRGGTPNISGIAGMGKAVEISMENMKKNSEYIMALRNRFIDKILREIPDTSLNGSQNDRLPGNANICFHGVDGEILNNLLDMAGIYASPGSACTGKEEGFSHVLYALSGNEKTARSSLRFTFSQSNTKDEIDHTADMLKEFTKKLRQNK